MVNFHSCFIFRSSHSKTRSPWASLHICNLFVMSRTTTHLSKRLLLQSHSSIVTHANYSLGTNPFWCCPALWWKIAQIMKSSVCFEMASPESHDWNQALAIMTKNTGFCLMTQWTSQWCRWPISGWMRRSVVGDLFNNPNPALTTLLTQWKPFMAWNELLDLNCDKSNWKSQR